MNEKPYPSFRVGGFACAIISDGSFTYPSPAKSFFASAPPDELTAVLQAHEIDPEQWDAFVSPYPNLLVEAGERLLLVDTGAGNLGPDTGKLIHNLRTAGIKPGDIDLIFITHAHPDHIGGLADNQGNLSFPKARYLINRTEWDFWMHDPDLSVLKIPEHLRAVIAAYPKRLLPLIEERVEWIKGGEEIIPGLRTVPAPGHTPGQLGLEISSQGQRLLNLVDAVLHPLHVEHPEWVASFDYSPDQTVTTRRQLLQDAAENDAWILTHHFPFPYLGRIVPEGQAWRWVPENAESF